MLAASHDLLDALGVSLPRVIRLVANVKYFVEYCKLLYSSEVYMTGGAQDGDRAERVGGEKHGHVIVSRKVPTGDVAPPIVALGNSRV